MTSENPVSRKDIMGVWRRVVLVDGMGNEDRESAVYWVQAPRLCGDIRQHRRVATLGGPPSDADLPFIDAFAGNLIETESGFRWEPALRRRDPGGPPDEGRLSWMGADLREVGVHLDYVEQWTRIAQVGPGSFALSLQDPDRGSLAYVLNIGVYLFYAYVSNQTERRGAKIHSEFSLFEMLPDGPRPLLSTAAPEQAICPYVEFADRERRTVWLSNGTSGDGKNRELWLVSAVEDCSPSEPVDEVSASVTLKRRTGLKHDSL
jgi:hypothetical protein